MTDKIKVRAMLNEVHISVVTNLEKKVLIQIWSGTEIPLVTSPFF